MPIPNKWHNDLASVALAIKNKSEDGRDGLKQKEYLRIQSERKMRKEEYISGSQFDRCVALLEDIKVVKKEKKGKLNIFKWVSWGEKPPYNDDIQLHQSQLFREWSKHVQSEITTPYMSTSILYRASFFTLIDWRSHYDKNSPGDVFTKETLSELNLFERGILDASTPYLEELLLHLESTDPELTGKIRNMIEDRIPPLDGKYFDDVFEDTWHFGYQAILEWLLSKMIDHIKPSGTFRSYSHMSPRKNIIPRKSFAEERSWILESMQMHGPSCFENSSPLTNLNDLEYDENRHLAAFIGTLKDITSPGQHREVFSSMVFRECMFIIGRMHWVFGFMPTETTPEILRGKIEEIKRKKINLFENSQNIYDFAVSFIHKDIEALQDKSYIYFPFDIDPDIIHAKVYDIALEILPTYVKLVNGFEEYSHKVGRIMMKLRNMEREINHGILMKGTCPTCEKIISQY